MVVVGRPAGCLGMILFLGKKKFRDDIGIRHRASFLNINSGGQTLPISAHEMAQMRAFSVLQKWPKIAKMTPNDLLTLKVVFTEPLKKTEQNTLLVS